MKGHYYDVNDWIQILRPSIHTEPSPEKPSHFKNSETKCNETKQKCLNGNPIPSFKEQASPIDLKLAVNLLPKSKTTNVPSCPALSHYLVLQPPVRRKKKFSSR